MPALRPETLAYLAGLVDGEGHVGFDRTHRPNGKRPLYITPRIVIGMTDFATLWWLHETVEGTPGRRKRVPGQKAVYIWQISGLQAIEFIRAIRPYLITKANQGDLFAQFGQFLDRGRRRLSESERAERQEIFDLMRECNRRGDAA